MSHWVRNRQLGWALASLVLTTQLMGCKTPTETAALYHGWSVTTQTGNPNILFVAAHESGITMGALSAGATGGEGFNGIGAVTLHTSDGDAVVWLDSQGLPRQARMDGVTVLYANWSASTVDVGLIAGDGTIRIVRGVQLPTSLSLGVRQRLLQLRGTSKGLARSDPAISIHQLLQWSDLALSAAGCGASIAGTISSGGALFPVAALACGSLTLKVWEAVDPNDDPAITGSATALGLVAGAVGCAVGDVPDCVITIADYATSAFLVAEDAISRQSNEVNVCNGALRSGSGDIQVTLTWDQPVDLDLWVTDPSGERIYYGHPQSLSGGRLDHDDTDGFGPENIYWPIGGAPAGTYRVQVNFFSPTGAADYLVLIQQFGQAKSYSGSILPGETVTIADFTAHQPLPAKASGLVVRDQKVMTRSKSGTP